MSPSFGAVANSTEMSGSDSTEGSSHGSEPFARYASESRKTGVRYLSAIRARLDRGPEAVARGRRGDDGHRRLAVAAVEDAEQVGLLRLRRHPGRRARALDVADDERQLELHREADRLLLQHDARPGRDRDAERAAERRAERGARGRDLVLGLEGLDAERLVARELLEDRRGRRDRVGAEVELQPRLPRRGDEADRERLVAGDVAVGAGLSGAGLISYETEKPSVVSPNA